MGRKKLPVLGVVVMLRYMIPDTMASPVAAPLIIKNEDQLLAAIRARCAELQITYETLDVVAMLPDGYASKLLCDHPVKHMGALTMWSILGTLGYRIGLVHDEELLARFCDKLVARKCPPQSTGSKGRVKFNFTHRFLRKIGRLGGQRSGQVRRARACAKQAVSEMKRRAALARWSRRASPAREDIPVI
jgi:hypothetical protein